MSALSDYFYKGPAITLNSGREITIQKLDQWLAYARVHEGIPYGPNYKNMVDFDLRRTREKHPKDKVIVIEPRLRPLPLPENILEGLRKKDIPPKYTGDDEDRIDENALDRAIAAGRPDPVSIGSACCCAWFRSTPIDPKNGDLSELIVIWYQDGFAMPIDPLVVEQIKAIDWESSAKDFLY